MSTPRLRDLEGEDPYELLGVAPTAGEAEIIAAYRRRVRQLHPDLPDGSERSTKLLHVARAILLDPRCRAEYDRLQADDATARTAEAAESDSAWDSEDVITDATDSPFSFQQSPPTHHPPPRTAGAHARVVFYRPRKYRDSLRAYILKIDGVRCGKIRQGSETVVDVQPGVHSAQAHIDMLSSPLLEFIARPGETVRFRVQPATMVTWISHSFNRAYCIDLDID